MGKRERHAQKMAREARSETELQTEARSKPPRAGFKDGWRWGSASLGLALRRPAYVGLGHALLAALVALAAWASNPMAWAFALALIVVGVECAGSAARAGILTPKAHPAPWRAWFEPIWGIKAFGAALARAVCLGAGLVGIGALAALAQRALWGSSVGNAGAQENVWAALAVTCVLVAGMCSWLLTAASAAAGPKALARSAWRALSAPSALAGLWVFWLALALLCQVALSFLLSLLATQGGAAVTMGEMSAVTALVALALCAPLAAISAGVASGDLQERERRRAAWVETPDPAERAPAVSLAKASDSQLAVEREES
jgi:hypothetical protein